MKKHYLISLLTMLCMAIGVSAQNNTYNMVIEMANGTKLTIGPNDVKNITFNDGELTATGESIETLMKVLAALQTQAETLQNQNQTLQTETETLQGQTGTLQTQANATQAQVEVQGDSLKTLSATIDSVANEIAAAKELAAAADYKVDSLSLFGRYDIIHAVKMVQLAENSMSQYETKMNNAQADINTLKSDVSTLKSDVSTMKTDVSTAKSTASSNEKKIASLEAEISQLKKTIEALQKTVNQLSN